MSRGEFGGNRRPRDQGKVSSRTVEKIKCAAEVIQTEKKLYKFWVNSLFSFIIDDFGGGSEYDRLFKQVGNNVQQINNNGMNPNHINCSLIALLVLTFACPLACVAPKCELP